MQYERKVSFGVTPESKSELIFIQFVTAFTVTKINLIQIGDLEFRSNLRFFRVIFLVFRTILHYINSKTDFGPGLEQF